MVCGTPFTGAYLAQRLDALKDPAAGHAFCRSLGAVSGQVAMDGQGSGEERYRRGNDASTWAAR